MPEATSNNCKSDTLTIPSDLKWMPKVVGEVERVVEEAGFDGQSSDFLAISVTEVVNNAILHGNKQDAEKKVIITFDQTPEQLAISITDEGAGFNPEECKDPTDPENISKRSGRGIYILKKLMDEVKISSSPKGTTFVLVKYKNPVKKKRK